MSVDIPLDQDPGQDSGQGPSPSRALAPPGRSLIDRVEGITTARFFLIALVVFVVISLRVYWPQLPGNPHSIVGCACGDEMQEVWFLKWTPWAILHGHNPFFTNWMDYPSGANLATNTVMPALAILVAPVTWLFGAISSYNLLMWASFPVSALACCFVVRRVTASNLAALVAGALYGFSPYMVGQGVAHVFLIFAPLPPLIFYALFRIVVVQEGSARRWGLVLAVLVIVQFFISQEVAADTVIVAAIALVILILANRGALTRRRVDYALRAGLYSVAIAFVVLAYPVYFQLLGPQAIHGATHGTTHSPLKLDVLGTIVPNSLQWWSPSFLSRLGNKFMGGDLGENGSYLGAPLVAVLGLILWKMRANRWVLYVTGVLLATEILSMGRWLMVANHTIHVPLPWTAFGKISFLQSDLPNRFALFASFFVAVLVALGITRWRDWSRQPVPSRPRVPRVALHGGLSVLAVASFALYLPRLPIITSPVPVVPAFFTSPLDLQIPAGSVVLPFPISASPHATSMLWQVRAGFRWKMIGGEAIIPTPRDHVTGQPASTRPVQVTQFLSYWSGANTRDPTLDDALVARMREFVFLNDVGTVVLDPTTPHASQAFTLFRDALGAPTSEGGLDVWFHAQRLARAVAATPQG